MEQNKQDLKSSFLLAWQNAQHKSPSKRFVATLFFLLLGSSVLLRLGWGPGPFVFPVVLIISCVGLVLYTLGVHLYYLVFYGIKHGISYFANKRRNVRTLSILIVWGLGVVLFHERLLVGLDPATVIALVALPTLWLTRMSRLYGYIGIVAIIIAPMYYYGGDEKTAEKFAIITFYSMVFLVVRGMQEVRSSKLET